MKYTAEEIKQHRAEWVAALRSGKYPQTKNKLRDHNGYCCLGVACELSGGRYNGHDLNLTPHAAEWLGVTESEPRSGDRESIRAATRYTRLNDFEDYTFPMIADHFEEYGFHPSIDVLAQEGAES